MHKTRKSRAISMDRENQSNLPKPLCPHRMTVRGIQNLLLRLAESDAHRPVNASSVTRSPSSTSKRARSASQTCGIAWPERLPTFPLSISFMLDSKLVHPAISRWRISMRAATLAWSRLSKWRVEWAWGFKGLSSSGVGRNQTCVANASILFIH